MDTNDAIRAIQVEDRQNCDFIQMTSTRFALIGKVPGTTRVQILFADEEVEPMLFSVNINEGDSSVLLLANWCVEIENQLNQSMKDASISVFQFQNRIFVKGVLGRGVKAPEVLAAVQKDFVRLRKEHSGMEIPGLTSQNRKMVLVDMLAENKKDVDK